VGSDPFVVAVADHLISIQLTTADDIHAVGWNLGCIVGEFGEMGQAGFQASQVAVEPTCIHIEADALGLHVCSSKMSGLFTDCGDE